VTRANRAVSSLGAPRSPHARAELEAAAFGGFRGIHKNGEPEPAAIVIGYFCGRLIRLLRANGNASPFPPPRTQYGSQSAN